MDKNSLNLWGDGDDLDVVVDVEQVFDLKLSNQEAESCRTVGDLYDLIVSKRRSVDLDTRACLSQAAFYRLRRAFAAMGANGPITPATPLHQVMSEIGRTMPFRRTWKELGQRAKLTLPSQEVAWLPEWPRSDTPRWKPTPYRIVFFAFAAAVIFSLHRVTGMSVGWAVFAIIVTLFALLLLVTPLLRLGFGNIPRRIATVGDLARDAAGFSFKELWQEKNGYGPSDLWFALTAILRQISGHKGFINRETTFFAHQARAK